MADILDQIRSAFDGEDTPKKNLALRKAHDEIELLRVALVRYGDRLRMSIVEPTALQQVIDAAFERTPSPQPNVAVDTDLIERVENCVLFSTPAEYAGLADHAAFEAGQDNAIANVVKMLRAALATTEGQDNG